jgi:predicted dehydrogenase
MPQTADRSLSIGILGAARIARKNCRAASHPSTSCKVVALASRDKEKGDTFDSEVFSTIPSPAPIVYGGESSYATLLADTSCEAVYIPLPSRLHYKYVISALKSGKHVLLEKPVANSADEYREMLKAAGENGRF